MNYFLNLILMVNLIGFKIGRIANNLHYYFYIYYYYLVHLRKGVTAEYFDNGT